MQATDIVERGNTFFLITPKREVKNLLFHFDQEHFAKPVKVVLTGKTIGKFLIVRDLVRGGTYPVSRRHLKREYQLTCKQRKQLKAR